MAHKTITASSCKDSEIGVSPANGLSPTSSHVPSTLAVAAAVIFTLASASTNLFYGLAKGVDLPTSIIWGSVAVAASIGLALAPSALIASLSARRYTAATVAFVAIMIFGAYSVTAALGSASGSRTAAQSEATEILSARKRHQTAYDTSKAELDTLAAARPSAEIAAEIEAIDRLPGIIIDGVPCGGTLNGKITKQWCPKRAELVAEKGRSDRRSDLQAAMADASAELAKLPRAKVANSDAAALAGYLEVVGQPLSTDALNKLLVVLAVLVIEFGGGLCLALALALRPDTADVSAQMIDTKITQDVSAPLETPVFVDQPTSAAKPNKSVKRTRKNEKNGRGGSGSGGQRLGTNVVELLKQNGGRLEGGQRGLGRLLGASKSRINEVLRELHESGVAVVSATKIGTKIELVAA